MKSVNRNSSIELYRILAMEMIVTLHFFSAAQTGQGFAQGSRAYFVYHIMESASICGVNMFVLITGFFANKKHVVDLIKILKLCIDVGFWGGIGYLLCVLFENELFSIRSLIKELFPILFGAKWFVKAYILLLVFIPFLNVLIASIRRNSFITLLVVCLVLFSLWPALLPNPPIDDFGYSFVHLMFVYLIGSFLHNHCMEKLPSKTTCVLGYFLCVLIVSLCSFYGNSFAWAYNNVFVILEAVFLFMLFLQIEIKSILINELASCAFGVFLIHTCPYFNRFLYEKMFHVSQFGEKSLNSAIVTIFLCASVIYIVGYILEKIKKLIFKPTIEVLLNRCTSLNVIISSKDDYLG